MANNKQLEAEFTEDNMLVLIESRTMRDQYVYREEVLEKVKEVAFLTDNFEITIQTAADYYEVPFETIKSVIKRNRDEFNEYGELRVLKGKLLRDFKGPV